MSDLKDKVSASIETIEAVVTNTGDKIRAAVRDGKHVLADAGNDAKDMATIAGAKLRIKARSTVGDVRRGAKKLTTPSKPPSKKDTQ